ncbi:MAG: helix-turn-helix transcriptional regulator [Clostridia bacterium]|nr:helix-turn-helix transcriptional regulator [Clostridia bacterium]
MTEKNLNATQLAEQMGIPSMDIYRYVSGTHMPSYALLIKLLNFFECSADYLLGQIDIPTEELLHPVLPFCKRLPAVLKELRISKSSIIKNMHVSPSVMHKWTTGKNEPNSDTLIKLAKYLDCSVDYLIGRVR